MLLRSSVAAVQRESSPLDVQVLVALSQLEAAAGQPESPAGIVAAAVLQHLLG
jgi:hypothetical protein